MCDSCQLAVIDNWQGIWGVEEIYVTAYNRGGEVVLETFADVDWDQFGLQQVGVGRYNGCFEYIGDQYSRW